MDTNTRVICEILGFKVTYFRVLQNGELSDAYFAICNSDSEVVSQKYKKITEPLTLLLKVENLILENKESNHLDGYLS